MLPTFWCGFKYGCIGGFINYTAKRVTHSIYLAKDTLTNVANPNALLWAWPAKIIHSAGSSIIENAAKNSKNIFSTYRVQIGFINLSLSFEDQFKIKGRLMPFAFTSFASNLLQAGNNLRLRETLFLSTPYFVSDNGNSYLGSHAAGATSNCIIVERNTEQSSRYGFIMAHENIHILQEREYQVFNKWLEKPYYNLVNQDKATIKFLNKYVYPDFQYMQTFYQFFDNPINTYYKNIFELEAEHFATNSFIKK